MSTESEKKTANKPTGRRYASVEEMMRVEGVSSEVQAKYEEIERETRLVNQLVNLRRIAGKTQHDMAQILKVTQSAVSKLEAGRDEEVTVGEIRAYVEASGERIGVCFGKPLTHVEAVKICADQMKKHLSALATIAQKEKELEQAIQAFFGEAFFSIMEILSVCVPGLPSGTKQDAMAGKMSVRMEVLSAPGSAKDAPAMCVPGGKIAARVQRA